MKRFAVLLVCLLALSLVLGAAGCGSTGGSSSAGQKLYAKAKTAQAGKQYTKAAKLYEQAIPLLVKEGDSKDAADSYARLQDMQLIADTYVKSISEVKADIENFLSSARNTNCAWSEAQILPVYVRRNITLAEAPSYGQTIFEYDPSCHGSTDYKQVAQLIHNRMQVKATESTNDSLATEHTEVTEIAKKPPIEIIEIPSAQPAQTPTANIELKET